MIIGLHFPRNNCQTIQTAPRISSTVISFMKATIIYRRGEKYGTRKEKKIYCSNKLSAEKSGKRVPINNLYDHVAQVPSWPSLENPRKPINFLYHYCEWRANEKKTFILSAAFEIVPYFYFSYIFFHPQRGLAEEQKFPRHQIQVGETNKNLVTAIAKWGTEI